MEPGQQFGEYVLQRRLGAGGQGEVYEVRDPIGMVWALKIGHRVHTDDQAALARFAREAQWVNATLGALPRNSGILVGEHYGVHDHRFYVKMRLVHGESLAQRLNREGPLPLSEVIALVRRLTEIIALAHQHHAIHRDLKPENVLLEQRAGLQVVDWGCIHLVEAGQFAMSGTGNLCTLGYAAPEQYELQISATPATDVYALGVMFFEMLTGYHPFLDSWRGPKPRAGRGANGSAATRTAAPGKTPSRDPSTELYPTAHVRKVRERDADAITRSTAETDVWGVEERLLDFPEPGRTSQAREGTGQFKSNSIATVITRQLTFDLGRLRPLTAPLPAALVGLLGEMLQPRLDKRLTSMTQVAERLTQIADELENATPEPAPPRGRDRRRGWAMIFAAVTAGSLGAAWWMSRSDDSDRTVNSADSSGDTAAPLTERSADIADPKLEPRALVPTLPTNRVDAQTTPSHVSAPRPEDAPNSDSLVTTPGVVALDIESEHPASPESPRSPTAKTRKPAPASASNSVAPPGAPTSPGIEMPYFEKIPSLP